jgi:hypothetical protein
MVSWKDAVIGSVSTLVVTVVAGVLIYYFTKEPPPKAAAERVVYEIQRAGEFQSTTTKLALQTIRVGNLGDAPASQVRTVIEYPSGISVVDKLASLSSGPAGVLSIVSPTPQVLQLSVDSLTPGETLTLSVVLDQGVQALPKVSVKSDRSLGTAGELLPKPAELEPTVARKTAERLLPFLLVLQIPLALFFARRIRRVLGLPPIFSYERCLNNSAFVLLHQGCVEDASRLLHRALLRGQADANVFANRALCLALADDHEGAARSLAAAQLFDRTGEDAGIIRFNQALIALLSGDEANASQHLEAAVKADRRQVIRWARYSVLFQKYATADSVRRVITSSELLAGGSSNASRRDRGGVGI